MKLSGKTALVTGGAMGIGQAIAQRFAQEGAKVIVFDIEKPKYDVEYFQVDVSNEEKISQAVNKLDKVDILVNNAGIYFQALIEDTAKEKLDHIIDVNLKGVYLMSKHILPLIRKSKGTIINISSGIGLVPEPESPAYCATKAAVIMLTKCMAQQYANEGIRVNAILPGPIDTPMLNNALSKDELKEYIKNNPMKRIGNPSEVASVALFLASDESSYVTGGLYSVDGGESTSSVYSKK